MELSSENFITIVQKEDEIERASLTKTVVNCETQFVTLPHGGDKAFFNYKIFKYHARCGWLKHD